MVEGSGTYAPRPSRRDMGFTFRGVAGRHESRFGNDIGRDTVSHSRIEVEHVRLTADKSFEDFTATFAQQLGRFEPDVYKDLEEGRDPAAFKARLESMVGPSGFMLFRTSNHGHSCGSSASRERRCNISSATPSSPSR